MGRFLYDRSTPGIEIDDRALAHLKLVIISKLRRNESFAFSWSFGRDSGGGRTTVWINSSIPLQFVFYGSKAPILNRTWVETLTVSANSAAGLCLSEEPADTWEETHR